MKTPNLVSLFVLVFGIAAQADQGVTNDLPSVVLSCQEVQDGALVLDGAKTLTLRRDQFGQTYLTVIQKDQFAGNSTLIDKLSLIKKTCQGFVPCELYRADQSATQFFVNFLPQVNEAHLESIVTGAVDFICKN